MTAWWCASTVALVLASCTTGSGAPSPVSATPVPLDHVRHGHRLEVLPDGTLLLFGGFSNEADADERGNRRTFALAPGDDRWRRRADLPWGIAFGGSAIVGGVAYAVGDGALRYDAAADRWHEVIPRGTLPRSHFACAAIGEEIVVVGGFPAELAGPWRIDVATRTVASLAPPTGFAPGDHLHVVATLDDQVHLVGGMTGESGEIARAHFVLDGAGWQAAPDAPHGVWSKFAAVATDGSRLWCFTESGGLCYDARSREWTHRSDIDDVLGTPWLAMPACWYGDDSVWVLGGLEVEERRPVLLRFDIDADRWETVE